MKTFKTFGARGYTCQIDRIDRGLRELGLQESENPDFIYCNDAGYFEEAINYKQHNLNSKLILNTLDIPNWCPDFDLNKIYSQLLQADKLTTISEFVQAQLKHNFNLDSEVIYNPTKNINSQKRDSGLNPYPQYKYMMVGRLRDQSKRSHLAPQALSKLNELNKLVVVGSEDIGYGHYLGVVPDEQLNDLYNSVDYVFMCSLWEGEGLPGLESVLGGAIPIVCSDMSTFNEFYPKHWGCFPTPEAIANRIWFLEHNPAIKNKMFQEIKNHQSQVFKKTDYLEIANRIIQVAK